MIELVFQPDIILKTGSGCTCESSQQKSYSTGEHSGGDGPKD